MTGELSDDTGTPLTHAGDKTGEHSKYTSTPSSYAVGIRKVNTVNTQVHFQVMLVGI